MRYLIFFVIGLVSVACGGDDSPPPGDGGPDGGTRADGGGVDGGTGGEDGGGGSDGGMSTDGATPGTECGTETCDPATEVCVEGNFGGPTRIGCEDVPPGCEADRTCACLAPTYCNTGLMMCSLTGNNHIFCETGLD
jgi:hypothetical protein